ADGRVTASPRQGHDPGNDEPLNDMRTFRTTFASTLLPGLLATTIATAAPAVSAPAAGAREDQVQIHGVAVGSQRLAPAGDRVEAHYAYSERGRGDDIAARWKLDARGLPTAYDATGNDYWKVPTTEHFEVGGGRALWRNRIEGGETAWPEAGAFYLPANA